METNQEIPDFLEPFIPQGMTADNLKFEADSDFEDDVGGTAGDDGWGADNAGGEDAETAGGDGWGNGNGSGTAAGDGWGNGTETKPAESADAAAGLGW